MAKAGSRTCPAVPGQMSGTPSPVLQIEAKTSDGFFWCGRCKHVVDPPERELVVFEDAVLACSVTLKCPRCKKWEVRWRPPAVKQTREAWREAKRDRINAPVDEERAAQLFLQIKESLAA